MESQTEEPKMEEPKMEEKTLDITCIKGARKNIKDIKIFGDGDTFKLLCKASPNAQGWMKSTKVCNVGDNCLVQVSTQQKNADGSYALAEALEFVPHFNIRDDDKGVPRLVSTG